MRIFSGIAIIVLMIVLVSCDNEELGKLVEVEPAHSYTYYYSGSCDSHDYVDLGLSVKWATCNVGATNPDEPGGYYAWGETKPIAGDASWNSYLWGNGTSLKKYNYELTLTPLGNPQLDNLYQLEPEDDAAIVNWGSNWRMPTDAECSELMDSCSFVWAEFNGQNGYQVIGKNGNSIFLPACGFFVDGAIQLSGHNGAIWSSNISASTPLNAYELMFYSADRVRGSVNRFYGQNIRPVLNE